MRRLPPPTTKPGIGRRRIRLAVIVAFVAVGAISLATEKAAQPIRSADFVGDYFFDEIDHRGIFMVHVFEDRGKLLAQLDILDRPVELTPRDPHSHEYTAISHRGAAYSLTFSEPGHDGFNKLRLTRGGQAMGFTGTRGVQAKRLRDFHIQRPGDYEYRAPPQLEDGLEVADIRETGIDVALLEEMMRQIQGNIDIMQSMLIVKGGKLVFEEYMNGWDPPRLHRMQSVTKSFTSTMVGFAVQEGLIESIHDPLFEYLPEYASSFDEDKKKIQIEHLLTMSAGFEWNEFDTYFAKPEDCDSHKAEASDDYIEYVLEKPLSDEPGSRWYYNSGYPNILGYIIEKKSGMNLLEFAYRHLFETLDIERAYWHTITLEDRPSCAGGLWLTSRDMAKYGELYLRGGNWKGRQVLPASWVAASTQPQIDTGVEGGYGYFWWLPPVGDLDLYLASGTGGQYVVCIPTFDAVVVTTAQFNTNKKGVVNELLIKYVVPALAAAK